ncbi:MAG: 2-phosphosulfolactate phosphatase [Acidimicrobiia bacterium]
MTSIRRRSLLAGAQEATGPTVVIDVFRAFSTAAFALAGGVERLVLAAELDEARLVAGRLGRALLMGEEQGERPADFDLGNSPAEVLGADLSGTTVVHRSSAGTRVVRAALQNRAGPIYACAFVVASATARALAGEPEVTLVPAGLLGEEIADEDEACADHLEALLLGRAGDGRARLEAAFRGNGGRRLWEAGWAHPADLGLCLALDLFDFAMKVEEDDGLVVLRRLG